MSRFHHFAHLKDMPFVKVGDYVIRGQEIGKIGNTGHSSGPHLHYEVCWNRPLAWRFYPNGYGKDWVKAHYQNPTPFIRVDLPAEFSYRGRGFLDWDGSAYHPGIDINSPNDLGKPVKSPVNGRVAFVEGPGFIRSALGKLIPSMNGGFGNHVWIEMDETNPGLTV